MNERVKSYHGDFVSVVMSRNGGVTHTVRVTTYLDDAGNIQETVRRFRSRERADAYYAEQAR